MEDCLSEVCGFEPVSGTFLFVAREISNLHHAAWRSRAILATLIGLCSHVYVFGENK